MKIYTGFGDKGETALLGGKKVKKYNLRVEFYGTLDELNSFLGLIHSKNDLDDVDNFLEEIQRDIFTISAEAASTGDQAVSNLAAVIGKKEIEKLESIIDRISAEIPELKNFIIPGGVENAALSHVSRAVCRRAERILTRLMDKEEIRAEILVYLNRLSDLLFVLGRYINFKNNTEDILWQNR